MSENNVNEVIETTTEEVVKAGFVNGLKKHKKGLIIGAVVTAVIGVGAAIVKSFKDKDLGFSDDEYVDSYAEEVEAVESDAE